jgi:hypothetical protein
LYGIAGSSGYAIKITPNMAGRHAAYCSGNAIATAKAMQCTLLPQPARQRPFVLSGEAGGKSPGTDDGNAVWRGTIGVTSAPGTLT